jgi:hypothetical protein
VQSLSSASLDISAFLGTCSDEELRHMRLLSHLCAQTYYMSALTVSVLVAIHFKISLF